MAAIIAAVGGGGGQGALFWFRRTLRFWQFFYVARVSEKLNYCHRVNSDHACVEHVSHKPG